MSGVHGERLPDAAIGPAMVLACPMASRNGADATTVRDYLGKLLALVWQDSADFNGKRPFGNSGWEFDLHLALVAGGLLDGEIDEEEGWLDSVDTARGDQLIAEAIAELVAPPRWGERVVDGGTPGVIVRCSVCGGSGELHQPDSLPAAQRPTEAPEPDPQLLAVARGWCMICERSVAAAAVGVPHPDHAEDCPLHYRP